MAEEMIEEIIHENTLFAEPIMHLGHFTITNSLLTSALALIIIITLAWLVRRNLKEVPTGIQNVLEMIVDAFLGIFDSVTGSRKKFFTICSACFSFLLFYIG